MIPTSIHIVRAPLPDAPGVYLMKDEHGTVLYVGKAVNLARRVRQHFERPHNALIEEMTKRVREIEYVERSTALEALILEANLIKQFWPKYNTDQKDGKSFLYLAITREAYPKPLLIRGADLPDNAGKLFLRVFGPYPSGTSLKTALDYLRRIFPWSTCAPGAKRACFNVHLGLCPGVCTGAISSREYKNIIRDLIAFFDGKKEGIVKAYTREMKKASKEKRYEEAKVLRDKIFALMHIQDVAMMKREDFLSSPSRMMVRDKLRRGSISSADSRFHGNDKKVRENDETQIFLGRIEGYDISHISGTSIVASMVVFEDGAPKKTAYRKFKMKFVTSNNDVASIAEVIARRMNHPEWGRPDMLLIDGGVAQVKSAEAVLNRDLTPWGQVPIPVLGIAKGRERKRNDIIAVESGREILLHASPYVDLLAHVRDEAHRFAINFHRQTRKKTVHITSLSGVSRTSRRSKKQSEEQSEQRK